MKSVQNPTQFRSNICIKLKEILLDDKLCNNLEKGIYNYSVIEAEKLNVVKKWDNIYFVQLYIDKLKKYYH